MADHRPPIPECSVCLSPYDNAFKVPLKLLPCAHTFCLECLAQLCLFMKPMQLLPCPLCRAPVTIPPGGAPALPMDTNVISQLPAHQRSHICRVWMEGSELCHWRLQPPYNRQPMAENGTQDVVVRIQLIHPTTSMSQPADLITVRGGRIRHQCREMCRSFWCLTSLVFVTIVTLFSAIFFPIYLIRWTR
ncbi:RING finger protein 223-like [Erpetoichthys calabaricus]|uniref:RING finger protein 223-like n=1 Tax=Erpetoichthys calabaricus TaxID=27687 RepID=UPI00223423F6|nr:RING finger protein 223-like [Erpetoichthys calabaricus]